MDFIGGLVILLLLIMGIVKFFEVVKKMVCSRVEIRLVPREKRSLSKKDEKLLREYEEMKKMEEIKKKLSREL